MEKVTELKEKVKIKRIVIPIVIVVILCVVAFNAFVVVDAGHTGVVVTMGKVNEGVLQEGIHLKIPFIQSVVKIDKSLLNNIGKANSHDEIILRNVVKMARELDKDVIAEGVETQEQADYLEGINCGSAQGFLFDKPLVRDDFQKRLIGEVVY